MPKTTTAPAPKADTPDVPWKPSTYVDQPPVRALTNPLLLLAFVPASNAQPFIAAGDRAARRGMREQVAAALRADPKMVAHSKLRLKAAGVTHEVEGVEKEVAALEAKRAVLLHGGESGPLVAGELGEIEGRHSALTAKLNGLRKGLGVIEAELGGRAAAPAPDPAPPSLSTGTIFTPHGSLAPATPAAPEPAAAPPHFMSGREADRAAEHAFTFAVGRRRQELQARRDELLKLIPHEILAELMCLEFAMTALQGAAVQRDTLDGLVDQLAAESSSAK